MQTARHILSALLILGLVSSGLPLTEPEDANHDKRVDLEDAILCIRDLVQTAKTPGSFAVEEETAISALYQVAELKKSIGPVNDTKSKPTSRTSNGFYLVSSVNTPDRMEKVSSLPENCILFESLSLEPPTPPPEMDCPYSMASAVCPRP
jgi:hypothetical protein